MKLDHHIWSEIFRFQHMKGSQLAGALHLGWKMGVILLMVTLLGRLQKIKKEYGGEVSLIVVSIAYLSAAKLLHADSFAFVKKP